MKALPKAQNLVLWGRKPNTYDEAWLKLADNASKAEMKQWEKDD